MDDPFTLKYSAVVVVYNKSIDDSTTCKCLRKVESNIKIIIVDNSETDQNNLEACKKLGFTYISMCGNKGLSKAYNVAIDVVEDTDILVLLDDDTTVPKDYFKKVDEAARNYVDVDIFAPIVYGQDGVIYSPNEFNFLRNHFIKTPKQNISQKKFNAIASCLAIRMRVFDNYRFNESLFVDQVDQFFFCEQRKKKRKFMKLDIIIKQNFYQRGEILTATAGWKRIRLRIIDVMRHARLMRGFKYRILGFMKCCGLSVQIAKKSKSLGILVKGGLLTCKLLFFPA